MEDQQPIRLAILSEVALAAPDAPPRPIHALRAGTFTDMRGREVTFSAEDMAQIAERLNAAAARRKPPINEGHNFGRAVGRITGASATGDALYLTPRWNSDGRRLLSEEVYDGFSIELQAHAEGGWYAVGGALTNYPAVDGLQPVTLSAPPLPPTMPALADDEMYAPPDADVPLAPPAPVDTPDPALTQETPPMSDEQPTVPAVPEPPAPPLMSDPAIQAQFAAYNQQMQAHFRAQFEEMQRTAQAEAQRQFQQWQAEQKREASILAFAQHVTTPTIERQHALPFKADQVADALRGLNDAQREKVEALLSGVVESGLVAFDRVGSGGGEGEQRDAKEQYEAAILAKVAGGMSRLDAIRAVNRERPDLYTAMQQPKGGN